MTFGVHPTLDAAPFHALDQPPAGPAWNQDELADLLPTSLHLAAVLVGLVPRATGTHLFLTRRTDTLRHHAGQIAFPGGRVDAGDRGAVEAALRETEEEVGIPPQMIRPLGFLDPYATITGFRVLPVVAELNPAFTLTLQDQEVAEVFEVPLDFVMQASNAEQVQAEFRGRMRHYWQFNYGTYRIWGATAAMILNLRRFLERAP